MVILADLLNTITVGDARDLAHYLPNESVDLIFTDPPYQRDYFHCYEALADFGPRVLKHGGSLVTIIPGYNLPSVVALFTGRLKWRDLLSMNQASGPHPRLMMGIEVCHKPMGWWVKGSYPQRRGFLKNQVDIKPPDKVLHKWQQDLSWCLYYIEKLTRPGDVVLDPFFCSGTVGEACWRLGRQFIAFEIDPVIAKRARQRLAALSGLPA